MFCRKCGVELRRKAKFCHKCGTPVPAVAAATSPKPAENPVKPAEEVETLLTRETTPEKVVHVPSRPEAAAAKPESAEAPKLIINMPETSASSSNGQFDEWFSEAGDL